MPRLTRTLQAWGTEGFEATLRAELSALDAGQLPLQAGLTTGSVVTDAPRTVMVLGAREAGECLEAKAGIFYSSVIAGCSCADDPTPVAENAEYCEVEIHIDRITAQATIALSGH